MIHQRTFLTCLMLLVNTMGFSPNPVIETAANGMSLLKPVFVAEAKIQAAVLGKLGGADESSIEQELAAETKGNKAVVYTYGLSPFSSEALAILDSSGYEYEKIELGAEWFLLGAKNSIKRVLLADQVENGATSLPKIFIGGQCIGGCAELAAAAKTGEIESLMKKARVRKASR